MYQLLDHLVCHFICALGQNKVDASTFAIITLTALFIARYIIGLFSVVFV